MRWMSEVPIAQAPRPIAGQNVIVYHDTPLSTTVTQTTVISNTTSNPGTSEQMNVGINVNDPMMGGTGANINMNINVNETGMNTQTQSTTTTYSTTTTTTSGGGAYSFTNLRPGTYRINVTTADGHQLQVDGRPFRIRGAWLVGPMNMPENK